MRTLILATRNQHKVEEIRKILGPKFDYRSLNDFPDAPEVVEDADSFEGNARKKAVELANWVSGPSLNASGTSKPIVSEGTHFVLADDSGLQVDALNGAPGVHSARFAAMDSGAAGNSPDSFNTAKLLRLLEKHPANERTARFRCVLALASIPNQSASPDSKPASPNTTIHAELFDGSCEGHIGRSPSGNGGFGYDPVFIPVGFSKTFAELGESIKNRISHRSLALSKLLDHLSRGG